MNPDLPRLLMEDHSLAYALWKREGFKNAICIHVDAHLDVMDRGFSPELLEKISQVRDVDDLAECHTPTFLPWEGVHCGNYLYPALRKGLITHLVWVVPKGLIASTPLLDFTREELQNWVELTLEEHDSLHLDGPRVEGVLAGQRFTLCTAENLPTLDQRPILLDIDVDYFQDQANLIWQTPGELCQAMNLKRIDALSIAFSVDGGYTCLEHRYLGEVTEQVFLADHLSPWETKTQQIVQADSRRLEDPSAYDEIPTADAPPWFKAAIELKRGLAEGLTTLQAAEAAETIDPRYRAVSMNEALVNFRSKNIDEALELAGDSDENAFLRGVIAHQSGAYREAKSSWDTFLATTELQARERAFALFTRGQSQIHLGEHQAAVQDLAEAESLSPGNYQYSLFHGVALQLTGDLKKAAKVWRKTLSRHDERLASIGLHLELSRLYRALGKTALADSELRRVSQKDKFGNYKMIVQLEHLRSGKLRPSIPQATLPTMWLTPLNPGGLR